MTLLRGLARNQVAQNTLWLATSYLIRLVAQAGSLILVARSLGVQEYGSFVAMVSIANLLSPFVDLGSYSLIVRDVAQGKPLPKTIGENISLLFYTTPVGILAYCLAMTLLLPHIPLWQGLLMSLGVFAGFKLYNVARAAFISIQQLQNNALLEIVIGVTQLAGAGILYLIGGSFEQWIVIAFAQQAIVGSASLLWVCRMTGLPVLGMRDFRQRARDGLHFALGGGAQTVSGELDKSLLPRLAGLEATGIYGLAQRICSFIYIPSSALNTALYAKYFERAAKGGYPATKGLMFRALGLLAAYLLVALTAIWVAAPLLVHVFGSDFGDAAEAVRFLLLVAALQVVQIPFADALTASGAQQVRSAAQIAAMLVNVGLNLALVPDLGWKGAAWSALLSQLVFTMWVCAPALIKRLQPKGQVLHQTGQL